MPETTSRFKTNIKFGKISHTEIMMFTEHMAIALKSGLILHEALEMLEDQASGKMKTVLKKIIAVVKTGQPLYKALEKYPKHFSKIFVNLIKTGEISGTLEENLKNLAKQLKKEHELRQKVQSAMLYPLLVLGAVSALSLSIAAFVLPKILPLFKSLTVELPLTTRGLLWIGEVFDHHGAYILIFTIAGSVFMGWFLRLNFVKPHTHKFLLKIPVLKNIIRNVNLAQFTSILKTLLGSGIPLDESLKIVTDATGNHVYRKAIGSFLPEIEKGNTLLKSIDYYPDLFPKFTGRMIGIGENIGNLEQSLEYLSDFYHQEVDTTMKNLSTLLEPVLLILIGGIVGLVAISILGPIYKITGNLR